MKTSIYNWVRKHAGTRVIRKGFDFILSNSVDKNEFKNGLPLLDALFQNGQILKNSATTTAVLATVPGCGGAKVFLKRTNNKGFRFTMRYLFRKARVFRAAKTGILLREAGIPTPAVLAAGERRFGWILRSGYLITESVPDAIDGVAMVRRERDWKHAVREAAKLLSRIHAAGVIHRDYKLQNIYFENKPGASCCVWDLDGARVFTGTIPASPLLFDLARLAVSTRIIAKEENIPGEFPEICREISAAYAPDGRISAVSIEAAADKFFLRK